MCLWTHTQTHGATNYWTAEEKCPTLILLGQVKKKNRSVHASYSPSSDGMDIHSTGDRCKEEICGEKHKASSGPWQCRRCSCPTENLSWVRRGRGSRRAGCRVTGPAAEQRGPLEEDAPRSSLHPGGGKRSSIRPAGGAAAGTAARRHLHPCPETCRQGARRPRLASAPAPQPPAGRAAEPQRPAAEPRPPPGAGGRERRPRPRCAGGSGEPCGGRPLLR